MESDKDRDCLNSHLRCKLLFLLYLGVSVLKFIIWRVGLMRGVVSTALAYKQFTISGITWELVHATIITSTIIVVLFITLEYLSVAVQIKVGNVRSPTANVSQILENATDNEKVPRRSRPRVSCRFRRPCVASGKLPHGLEVPRGFGEAFRVCVAHVLNSIDRAEESFLFLYVGMDVFDIVKWKVIKIGTVLIII